MISLLEPVTFTIASARPVRVSSVGLPMLTGVCSPEKARRTRPSMRSLTKQNDLVWEPSPNTVSGLPAIAWLRKVGTARPSLGRIRGPYVLKIRAIAVSTPCWR